MTNLVILVIGIAVVAVFLAAYFAWRCFSAGFTQDALQKLTQDVLTQERHKAELEIETKNLGEEYDSLCGKLSDTHDRLFQEEEKLKSAQLLASKELELQNEKLKHQAASDLDAELEQLKKQHPLARYRDILDQLNAQIAEARSTLTTHQAAVKAAEEEEDFNAAHSLPLTFIERADIATLREFAPKIARKDAVNKLIWTEWYQRPLQNLRKSLEADKKCGIYMIEEIGTGRMYIGQALNIGDRWAEHVKAGLGIGSTAYQTNKFYKAMHAKGPENFTFQILELCAPEKLNAREKYWIDFYNAQSFGFNTSIGG